MSACPTVWNFIRTSETTNQAVKIHKDTSAPACQQHNLQPEQGDRISFHKNINLHHEDYTYIPFATKFMGIILL
jgi:hypothetical protein